MKCPKCHSENLIRCERVKVKVSDGTFFQRRIICNDCGCEFDITESYSVFNETEVKKHAER